MNGGVKDYSWGKRSQTKLLSSFIGSSSKTSIVDSHVTNQKKKEPDKRDPLLFSSLKFLILGLNKIFAVESIHLARVGFSVTVLHIVRNHTVIGTRCF